MGTSAILDIIGSFITGGLILFTILQLDMNAIESRQTYGYNYRNQSNLTTAAMMLEDDFGRIAYCKNPADSMVNPAANALLACDSNRIRYRTDINDDAIPDVVEYSIANTPDANNTENPNDFLLIRRQWIGGVLSQQNWSLGITRFRFDYFQAGLGTGTAMTFPIGNPSSVGLMRLFIIIESPEKPKQEFLGDTSQYQVYWRQVRVTSKNLLFR